MTESISNLILDMDGVLWHGETPMPGLIEFFSTLRELGIGHVMATNNASKTAEQYRSKFARFGLDIALEQILTSAETTASYLNGSYPEGTSAYVVGDDGLRQAMENKGFQLISPAQAAAGAEAPLVVVGFFQGVSYVDLAMGALLVHKGARFIGTNPDPSFPSELGPLPGAGALQAVISTATGIQPEVIGKPKPIIFQEALRRLGGTPANTAMVGDRLSTDIAGGNNVGMQTILLLSGISTQADINKSGIEPTWVFENISALAADLKKTHLIERASRS